MPNQNPNQNTPVDQPVQEQSFQPDFQKISDEKTDSSTTPFGSGISSVISSPKKKFGTGKIIATILSLFLLIGGVGAGIALTQQQQLFNQKASTCTGCDPLGGIACQHDADGNNNGWKCVCVNTSPNGTTCTHDWSCGSKDLSTCPVPDDVKPPTAPPVVGGGTCTLGAQQCVFDNDIPGTDFCGGSGGKYKCYEAKAEYGQPVIGNADCKCPSGNNPAPGPYCLTNTPCQYTQGGDRAGTHCTNNLCTPTSPPSTDGPITVAPYCVAVKAYSSSWSLLTTGQLSASTPGTTINFCVSGSATSGSFDKAQFTIKGVPLAETTTKRSGSNDLCQSYTILSTDRTISVIAKIHHSTMGWYQ